MARVTLTSAGEDVTVGGSDVQVVGTTSGGEIITVVSGNVRLDPSFNQGGDTVVLPGAASSYSAYLIGTEVVLVRNDGLVTLRIPAGTAGSEIQFDGGDSRTLQINTTNGTIQLEGQTISGTAAAPTPIGGGATPLVGYDVTSTTASVNEGDTGTRQLVFTITLDRAVTAADGPVTLNYQTQNGTADSASDYVAAAGTVTFAVGQSVATVTVLVNGDTTPETNETLSLNLSGAQLRNGPETLVGTIINDDAAVALTGASDNLVGSAGNDSFFGANVGLGAGDKITDSSTTDSDTLFIALDGNNPLTNTNFGGFTLTGVENLVVTNDSTQTVRFDLSGSKNVATVTSANSSQTVVFEQLTSLAGVKIDDVTGPGADVQVIYQDALLAGATTINVDVNDGSFDDIILGGVTTGTTGIETVVLNVSGNSVVDTIATSLTNLTIQGPGSVKLDDPLITTIRTINASNAGSVDVNFSNNDAVGTGVNFTGSAGADRVFAGQATDTINTGAGADVVFNEGGNDIINTDAGDDFVGQLSTATGDVTINLGTGEDVVRFDSATFNALDKVTFDGSVGDRLVVSQSIVEADLVGVTGSTTLETIVNGTVNLGNNGLVSSDKATLAEGERAGIRTVNLNVNAVDIFGNPQGTNDTLLATDYVGSLTVNLGGVFGTDTVLLGSGDDTVRTASFDNSDVLQGNKGNDAIIVTDGSNFVTTASQFSGFESVTYLSDADGDDQFLIIDNDNAPTANGTLTVNASALVSIPAVAATPTTPAVPAILEQLFFDASAVTTYKVDVTAGAAADTIITNNTVAGDRVNGGAGDDLIQAGGGDIVDGGAGKDNITAFAGDNTIRGGLDADTITVAGVGNNSIFGDDGDDRIDISVSANLTKDDSIDGGTGTDTIAVDGTYVDAQFTGVSNVEVLEGRAAAASNLTIGAQAQEGGIRTVNLLSSAADVLAAGTYTADLTVNLTAGDDVVTTGSGNDTIALGLGNVTIDTGVGNDRILASGTTELDYNDKIAAGAGTDSVLLDNTLAGASAQVNLAFVTGVENFGVLTGGQTNDGKVADPDNNVLTIGSTSAEVFADLTFLNVSAANLTDVDDSFRLVLDTNLVDDDVAFNVTGSATATTIVEKLNINTDNNINFVGGEGVDILRINGADAGSTVSFDGNGGIDQIFLTGGTLTDDGFFSIRDVEVLTGTAGSIVAVLGAQAALSGITTITGTDGNENVTFGAGFNRPLTVTLGLGADTINAAASTGVLTFIGRVDDIQGDDTLAGGSTAGDVIVITEGGTSNLNGVSQVETVNVVNTTATTGQVTTLTLDATAAEVSGGRITINASAGAGDSLNVTSTNNVATGAGAAAAITVNGGAAVDVVQGGGGADIINGNDGADLIRAGAGNDTVNGGAGVDTVRGQLGDDTINGDADNDLLYGDFAFSDGGSVALYTGLGGGNDTLNGGAGADLLVGGLGRDTLTGGTGADIFRYQAADDSRFFPGGIDNRDRITDFNSADGDKIDLTTLAEALGQTIRFNGNYATFGEAQSAISGTATGSFLDAVYVQESDTLYVDVNNDGVLNGDDLQIILQDAASTFTLTGADVNATVVVGAPPVVATVDFDAYAMTRIDSYNFA